MSHGERVLHPNCYVCNARVSADDVFDVSEHAYARRRGRLGTALGARGTEDLGLCRGQTAPPQSLWGAELPVSKNPG